MEQPAEIDLMRHDGKPIRIETARIGACHEAPDLGEGSCRIEYLVPIVGEVTVEIGEPPTDVQTKLGRI